MNRARLCAVLEGALHVWRVEGRVSAAKDACVLRAAGRVVTVARVTGEDEPPYWEVAVDGVDDEGGPPPQPCAGIHGMLRAVRDLLDPESAARPLVIGGAS
jgi:hypothetical protein